MSFLVTGFSTFLNHAVNPSGELLSELPRSVLGHRVETLLLPVSHDYAPKLLRQQVLKQQPNFVIMLGLAAHRKKISLERVALNFADSSDVDNDGIVRRERTLILDGPTAILSPLPLSGWVEKLGSDFEVSLSAGAYVCNSLYYLSLFQAPKFVRHQLFIHLPPFEILSKDVQVRNIIRVLETFALS